jgi:uncharacterized protein (TIGR00725 family)
MEPVWVAVVGGGEEAPEVLARAEAVGRELASHGAVLVCGGLGGVMAAACRGARERGGRTVGLLPGLERAAANEWVEVAIPTGLGELRNGLVVRAADAVIAVGGEWGTLAEIAFARKAGLPVVGLGTWELARAGAVVRDVVMASDPEAAVAEALALAASRH